MKDLAQKLLAIFQIESREHLTHIRAILDKVEAGEGVLSGPALDDAFRRAHSLKGAARAVGLPMVQRLAHDLEDVFAKIRDGRLGFDRAMTPAFHLVLDSLEDTVKASVGGNNPPEPTQALSVLAALAEGRSLPVAPSPVSAPPSPTSPLPNLKESQAGAPAPEPAVEKPAAAETLRVNTGHIDSILEIADELVIEVMRQDAATSGFSDQTRALAGMDREQAAVRQQAASQLRRLATMPEFSSVPGYVNYLEHQLRTFRTGSRSLAATQRRGAWRLHQLTGTLRETVLNARMVPAESLYEGFGKMVRDLARSVGKEIVYEARGLATQADRGVLEALRDPIMHILRNAVDHAIETPEIRRRHAKPPAGSVKLSLQPGGGKLVVTVEDDGKGLDIEKIAQMAGQQGISGETEAERLIFQPGFSTTSAVTELSGRGMGLSVVHEAVLRLQGQVDVRRNDSGGVTFVLTTPLAISSQHLLLLSCSRQTFAIPAHFVERLHRANPQRDFELVEGKPVIHSEGNPVPVVYLGSLLNLEQSGNDPAKKKGHLPLAVVNVNGHRTAVVVDEFLSDRHAVVQRLGEGAVFGDKVAGAIILEDGSATAVLNLPGVLDPASASSGWSQTAVPESVAENKRSGILVVDDSMTTRTLEKNVLEAQGYRVGIAVDGSEALARLQTESFDLVITDVEMPVMTGFELIQEMKKNPKLARIPVIIVSSLEKREDKERGMSLGADAYIVKRSFEQQELLETIRQMI